MAVERFLSAEGCKDLLARAVKLTRGGGEVQLSIRSKWTGNVRWARNEITTGGDTTDHWIQVYRTVRGSWGKASTSRIDDASLETCIRRAEDHARYTGRDPDPTGLRRAETYLKPELWSDATFAVDAAARAQIQQQMVAASATDGLLSAGYIEVSATGNGVINSAGLFAYVPETRAECSVTVRNARGTGSGWAGVAAKDWRTIDALGISASALDKCKRSADPVAVEPGRYTVILESQAVSELMLGLVATLARIPSETGQGPWADGMRVPTILTYPGGPPMENANPSGLMRMSKIGKRVLDPRITISADPTDPDIPFVPFITDSTPNRAVKWIENGVLKELAYPRSYGIRQLNKPDPLNNTYAFRMTGGTTSLDEMIKSTERGLLVTRLVNVRQVDYASLLQSGTTSDGVWLIERGQITKAVKNFRFRESPLFAFNNIDLMGPPVRVLQTMPTIAPAVRVKDFSMTSLADAV